MVRARYFNFNHLTALRDDPGCNRRSRRRANFKHGGSALGPKDQAFTSTQLCVRGRRGSHLDRQCDRRAAVRDTRSPSKPAHATNAFVTMFFCLGGGLALRTYFREQGTWMNAQRAP